MGGKGEEKVSEKYLYVVTLGVDKNNEIAL